jgi:cytoskeletal protein CcmA (bactofilin family)
VEGDVYSSEHIELAAKARVIGNVYYHLIEMVMGSEVNGSLYHRTPVELKPKQIDMQQNVKQSPGAGIEAVVVEAAKASS